MNNIFSLILKKSTIAIVISRLVFGLALLRLISLEENQYLKIVEILGLLISLVTSVSTFYSLLFGSSILLKDDEND